MARRLVFRYKWIDTVGKYKSGSDTANTKEYLILICMEFTFSHTLT